MNVRQLLAGLCVLLLHGVASAYDIQPIKEAAHVHKDPIHEALTLASLMCANDASARSVAELSCPRNEVAGYWHWWTSGKLVATDAQKTEAAELINGVRWPDDPLRISAKVLNSLKLSQIDSACQSYLTNKYGSCANRFCQTHYGNLQMLHAMAPAAPWCRTDANKNNPTCKGMESPVETRIKEWAVWLSAIATGQIQGKDPLFKSGPLPATLFDVGCDKVYPSSMTVDDLFFTSCTARKNSVKVTRCNVIKPSDPMVLRRLALGALLHTVQDSFSRAHVDRGSAHACPAPIVSCGKVRSFREYGSQSTEIHEVADNWPLWDASCNDPGREVDDPVTAGAKLILLARQEKPDAMVDYLMTRVFAKADPPAAGDTNAAGGDCFGRSH